MSDERPTDAGDASFEEMPIEQHRRASLVLRAEDVREARAESMAAANKALTDALRITYVLLLVVMGAIALMFLLSGYRQVNQAERGLKVSFGKIVTATSSPARTSRCRSRSARSSRCPRASGRSWWRSSSSRATSTRPGPSRIRADRVRRSGRGPTGT